MVWLPPKSKPPLPNKPELVYLCGPIDYAPGDARGWRERAAEFLLERGIASFSPAHAFFARGEAHEGVSQRIMAINFAALYHTDVCLAFLGNVMSIGTSREIQQAVSWGIPVVSVVEGRKPSHYLIDTWTTSSLEEALKLIAGDGGDI